MTEIKTPNWRLSSVAPQSTGHRYQITDRRTGQVTYFDSVKVYDGGLSKVNLYRDDDDMGKNGARAARFKDTDQFPTVILDALKHLAGGGYLSELGTRVNE